MIHIVLPGEGTLETFRILATGEQTRGAYFALELGSVPGGATSGHSHDEEDEAEYVATGTRVVRVDDQLVEAPAGTFVLVPRGSLHDMWTVGDEPSRYIHLFSPAGLERWFFERARMRAAGATRDDLSAAARRYGVRTERTSSEEALAHVARAEDGAPLLVGGSNTSGAYSLRELTLAPDERPERPHVHDTAEEAIYVATGELDVSGDWGSCAAPAGTFVLVPRGTEHAIAARGRAPTRAVVIVSPPESDEGGA